MSRAGGDAVFDDHVSEEKQQMPSIKKIKEERRRQQKNRIDEIRAKQIKTSPRHAIPCNKRAAILLVRSCTRSDCIPPLTNKQGEAPPTATKNNDIQGT